MRGDGREGHVYEGRGGWREGRRERGEGGRESGVGSRVGERKKVVGGTVF